MKKYFILILFIFVFVMSGCVKYKDPTTSTKPQTSTTPPSVATSDSTTNKPTTTTTITIPNDNRLEYDVFSNILKEFDSANNLTIKEENLTDENLSRNILLSSNKASVRNLNDDDPNSWVYYEDSTYKYYHEDGVWKRKIVEEAELVYIHNLNLKRYINVYNSFEYEQAESTYKLDEYIDSDTYTDIRIKIVDNKIISYQYTIDNNNKYLYTFTNYGNTIIDLPIDYNDVYEKLDNTGWDELLKRTANVTSFTSTNIFEDKIGEELYSSNASINKYSGAELHQSTTTSEGLQQYYYKINGLNRDVYEYVNTSWTFSRTEVSTESTFNQKSTLPIQLLEANYDKIIYNDIANTYSIKNFEYSGNSYSEVIIRLLDNYISHISIMYTYEVEGVLHNVTQVISYSEINTTSIDIQL